MKPKEPTAELNSRPVNLKFGPSKTPSGPHDLDTLVYIEKAGLNICYAMDELMKVGLTGPARKLELALDEIRAVRTKILSETKEGK